MKNPEILLKSFKQSKRASYVSTLFKQSGYGKYDLRKNYIVLKSKRTDEKGVILIKFAETFEGMILFSDIQRIMNNYNIVLEMSWDGVCDPTYFLFLNTDSKVFIETSSIKDHQFLKKIDTNLIPVQIASNDWTYTEEINFNDQIKKVYDIVMVAHWGIIKNHRKLFRALERLEIREQKIEVALIGFPSEERTKEDVMDEYNKIIKRNKNLINTVFLENIPHKEVLRFLHQSKVLLLLTYKEGGNKSIAEAFVCNTPVIVYEHLKGGVLEKINTQTGVVTSFDKLHIAITHMIHTYTTFSPRSYYLENYGVLNSTQKLNTVIKENTDSSWTNDLVPKINSPGLKYLTPGIRDRFNDDYQFLDKTIVNSN